MQVLDHRPGDGKTVKGRRTAADLVQNDQRAIRCLIEDGGGWPTPAQVKSGTPPTGSSVVAATGSLQAAAATTVYSTVVTGLTSEIRYSLSAVAEDIVGNLQRYRVLKTVTTLVGFVAVTFLCYVLYRFFFHTFLFSTNTDPLCSLS